MSFLMSLRRTTYVPPKFLPHRGEKRKMAVFRLKVHLSQKNLLQSFFFCENRQRQSCKAFIDLFIRAKIDRRGGRPL